MTNFNQNRRAFLKSGGIAALTLGLPAFNIKGAPAMPLSSDQDFWKNLRNQFPLSEEVSYLNNGTMGICPYPVLDAIKKSLQSSYENGIYGGGKYEAIKALSRLVNVSESEIALTHNVTEGINIVCWGLKLKKGDEVIITSHEHVGNGLPWLYRSTIDGYKLKVINLGATAQETLDNIKNAITKKTKVIAVPHIPCTNGQVLPAKEICSLARKKGIFSFIDGAHGPGMLQLDLHDMGCDAYASCCHKWLLAPAGTAFLYVKKDKLDEVRTLQVGGYSSKNWDLLQTPPYFEGLVEDAHRYHYGTQSAALYFGIEAAVKFHEEIGIKRVEERVKTLADKVRSELKSFGDKVKIITPDEEKSKAGVVAFIPQFKKYEEVGKYCNDNKTIVRIVPENGINCVRISTHIYNSEADIEKLMANLSAVL